LIPQTVLILTAAYLLGSIPFAWLAGTAAGVDIRKVGSRNVGASNVYRAVGPAAGILVLIADIAKGALAVWIAKRWSAPGDWILVLAGLAAIAGHTWTIFLSFQGGKGVATATGVLLSLVPGEMLICLGIFALCVAFGRMISLGSIITAIALPVVVVVGGFVTGEPARIPIITFTLVVASLVIWRHRSNIGRIASGTEARFSFRRGGSG